MFSGGKIWSPWRNTLIGGLLSNALLFVLFTGRADIFRVVFLFFLGGVWILLNMIRLFFWGVGIARISENDFMRYWSCSILFALILRGSLLCKGDIVMYRSGLLLFCNKCE